MSKLQDALRSLPRAGNATFEDIRRIAEAVERDQEERDRSIMTSIKGLDNRFQMKVSNPKDETKQLPPNERIVGDGVEPAIIGETG